MSEPLPPLALHLDPRRRDLLDRLLPIEARLALCLDHYQWIHPADLDLRPALEALIPEVLDAIRTPWERELDALEEMTPDERFDRVASASPTEFASAELTSLLGARSTQALPRDPRNALHWAELCGRVARRGSTPEHLEWRAHWLFLAADARRTLGGRGDREEAARLLDLGQLQLQTARSTDRTLVAERAQVLGRWHLDAGRPVAARREAARAAALADLAGRDQTLGDAAQILGQVHHQTGQPRRRASVQRLAVRAYRRAGTSPSLALDARLRLAAAWIDDGMPRAARGVLLRAGHLFDRYPDRLELALRRRWAIGKIAAALGETGEALRSYGEVLDGFLQLPSLSDAALVALDLALVFRLEGDTEGLRDLADEIAPRLRAEAETETETPDPRTEIVLAVLERAHDAALGELVGALSAHRRAALSS